MFYLLVLGFTCLWLYLVPKYTNIKVYYFIPKICLFGIHTKQKHHPKQIAHSNKLI